MSRLTCKACYSTTELFDVTDLGRAVSSVNIYPFGLAGEAIYYEKCKSCGFIFTRHMDHWNSEAFAQRIYNEDYIKIDPEYVEKRPTSMGNWTVKMISGLPARTRCLDYGSGLGVLANVLRQSGFEKAESYDPFSSPERPEGVFDIITCYEVVEHSPTPRATFAEMVSYLSDNGVILVSTLCTPENIDLIRSGWEYFGPRNGHVSFYTPGAFHAIADQLGLDAYTTGMEFHVFARKGRNKDNSPFLAKMNETHNWVCPN